MATKARRDENAGSPLITQRGHATFQRRQDTVKEQEGKRMPRRDEVKKNQQEEKLQVWSTEGGVKKIARADRKANFHFVLETLSKNPA